MVEVWHAQTFFQIITLKVENALDELILFAWCQAAFE